MCRVVTVYQQNNKWQVTQIVAWLDNLGQVRLRELLKINNTLPHKNHTVFSSLKVFCWNIPILFWDSLATASTSLYLYENGQCCSPHVRELTVYFPSLIQNSHSFTGSSLEFYAQWDISHIAIESRECISRWIFLISCIPTKYTDLPPQVSCRQCRARELFARYSSQSMDSY